MADLRAAVRLAGLRLLGPLTGTAGDLAAHVRRVGAGGSRPDGRMQPTAQPTRDRRPRILLVRPDHLGDVLLASPAARVLADALPGAVIDWLVGPWSAEMARRAGSPGGVLTLGFPGFTRRPKHSLAEPYVLLLREAARLRAEAYDAALILRPDHWWGAMLAAAAGIPRRFGYSVAECRPFLTDTLPMPSGRDRHAVRANQQLARLASVRLGNPSPRRDTVDPEFPVLPDELRWAREWIAAHLGGTPAGHRPPGNWLAPAAPIVAIHPGAGSPLKTWSPDKWASVARTLRERHHARVFLTGGPGEVDVVQAIASRLDPRPPATVGETNLGQLAALFASSDLVLGCDSGPLHLAAAVGPMTIRLYGPTDTAEFGPWPPGDPHWSVNVWACPLRIQPCGAIVNPPCGAVETPACLREIAPDAVASLALELLRYGGRDPAGGETRRSRTAAARRGEPPC